MPALLNTEQANARRFKRLVYLLFGLVIAGMLFAGLRPYSSYADRWVTFDDAEQHTVFRHYGLATGPLDQAISTALLQQSAEISMTVKLQTPPDGRFQILAQIDSAGSTDPLVIGQWRSNIIVMSGLDYRYEQKLPRVSTDLLENMGMFVDVAIALEATKTSLVVNDKLVGEGPAMAFTLAPSRITIGNGPDGQHGWKGELRQFQLKSTVEQPANVQYQFDENNLPTIAGINAGADYLIVPSPGDFPDKVWIQAMRWDQLLHANLHDVVFNFLGFSPFGYLLFLTLYLRSAKPSNLQCFVVAVTGGLLFSLVIETAQTYIPGRSPHAHDLILNTLGSAAGALIALVFLWLWRQTKQLTA